jgi:glycosyltransferase involved in cell wall biosynthesis
MKIYSYLHSGAPVVATRLPTHTQVLTDDVAALAEATPEDFAEAINELLDNPIRAQEIGLNAKRLAEERYTFEQFEKTLNSIYDAARAQRDDTE